MDVEQHGKYEEAPKKCHFTQNLEAFQKESLSNLGTGSVIEKQNMEVQL